MMKDEFFERMRCAGSVRVSVAASEALRLFTARGERAWVNGWDPRFPAGDESLDMTVGTVWVTTAHGAQVVWTVADRTADRVRYVRIVPGIWAGTVEVTCTPDPDDRRCTRARVVYDTTPLSGHGQDLLRTFASGYEEFLKGWESDILKACP
jgi:hypothetical protein